MAKISSKQLYSKNTFYHLYNRGNRKRLIFNDDRDHIYFLNNLFRNEDLYDLNLYGFCLMPNHYHLLICLGNDETAISKYMHKCMTSYSMYFNKRYDLVGRLCQSPFQAVKLTSTQSIIQEIEYFKQNPVKTGLVKNPDDYRWLKIFIRIPSI